MSLIFYDASFGQLHKPHRPLTLMCAEAGLERQQACLAQPVHGSLALSVVRYLHTCKQGGTLLCSLCT